MFFGKKKKILFVDDNESIVSTSSLILEDMGFNVITAKDGEEALNKANAELPDLIVLDVNLPKMSGFDVCRTLKKQPKTMKIPVILLTGLGKTDDVNKGFLVGAVDYLIKPVDWNRLKSKISALIKV